MYLHEHQDFEDLVMLTSEKGIVNNPYLVEKDYWIMHCLYGLQELKMDFELKGGTSLSKGYEIIDRFSEDIDLKITPKPEDTGFKVYEGKNHMKPAHIESRSKFYDWLSQNLEGKINGITKVERAFEYDDPKYRSGGIRLIYNSKFSPIAGIKEGILLEVGFAKTTPSITKNISSWVFDKGHEVLGDTITSNKANCVQCYDYRYTFVEKLHSIVRRFNQYKKSDSPDFKNFLRHFYDIYSLLDQPEIQDFLKTETYQEYKNECFGNQDQVIANCDAFTFSDHEDREIFTNAYKQTSALYYKSLVPFDQIIQRLREFKGKL
jgi:hypothetical protein